MENKFSVTLDLGYSKKLQKLFPQDPQSNVTLVVQTKQYNLQKAYIELESEYFQKLFKKDPSKNYYDLDIKSDSKIFENILKIFFGTSFLVTEKELYMTYELCQSLEIEGLIHILDQEIVKNIDNLNFFQMYDLGLRYQKESIINALNNKLINNKFSILQNDDIFEENEDTKDLYPSSIIGLESRFLIKLIKFHNKQKTKYLSYLEIFKIIQNYCNTKYKGKPEKIQQSIKLYTEELIDKKKLSSKEFQEIYHKNLLSVDNQSSVMTNDIEQSFLNQQQSNMSNQNMFTIQVMQSENILLQKTAEEQINQNKILQQEIDILKQQMQGYLQESNNFKVFEQKVNEKLQKIIEEAESRDLENNNRINKLEQMLSDVQLELSKKNQEISQLKSINQTLPYKTDNGFYPNLIKPGTPSPNLNYQQQNQFYVKNNNTQIDPQNQMQNINNNNNQQMHQSTFESSPFLNQTAESFYIVQNQQFGQQFQQQQFQQQQQNQSFTNQQQQQISQINTNYDQNPFLNNNEQNLNQQIVQQIQNKKVNQKSGQVIFDNPPETIEQQQYDLLSKFLDVYSPKSVSLNIVYRGSRDGFSPESFHEKCDGKRHLLILIKSWDYEKVFGGYISVELEKCEEYLRDENAFIFSIDNQEKYPTKNGEFSLYFGQDYILCFGTDIMIGENCDIDENSSCKFPTDYICNSPIDDQKRHSFLTGATQFQVDDLEVYQVEYED